MIIEFYEIFNYFTLTAAAHATRKLKREQPKHLSIWKLQDKTSATFKFDRTANEAIKAGFVGPN